MINHAFGLGSGRLLTGMS